VYPFESVQFENKCHCRCSTFCLIFYDDFQMMFQHLWNQRDNQALWCLSTGCLGSYVEFRYLLNTKNISQYISFGNQEHVPFTVLIIIRTFITSRLSVAVLLEFDTAFQLTKAAVLN